MIKNVEFLLIQSIMLFELLIGPSFVQIVLIKKKGIGYIKLVVLANILHAVYDKKMCPY